MNDLAIGRALRAIRLRTGARQADVARRARLSQDEVSLVERGRLERVSLRRLREVARALDAEVVMYVRWRGGELDRLLDERHARLGGIVTESLTRDGWTVLPEVTYSIYGERGSIDLLAWHPVARALLVIELKTEITSAEETLRRHDQKVRLAPSIVRERFGWEPESVGRLLVLPASTSARRRVARHRALFDRVYPDRNIAVRRYMRRPGTGVINGLWFAPETTDRRGRSGIGPRKRVRRVAASRLERDGASSATGIAG